MNTPAESTVAEGTQQTCKRRGLFAAAWAAIAGLLLTKATQPVAAAAGQQFQDVGGGGFVNNSAGGPSALFSNSLYTSTSATFVSYAFQGSARAGISGVSGSGSAVSPAPCGVYGTQNKTGVVGSAGVIGDNSSIGGIGVLGSGLSVGVRGELSGSDNGWAVFAVNGSSFKGAAPGAGGWGIYGASQWGHAFVGASSTAGAGGMVGSNNGIAGAYAALFYGPTVVSGDFTVVGGAKSAAVAHPDGTLKRLYCVESPESWFEDFGKGQLACGVAEVTIDPDFAAVAHLDDYHVFLTSYGKPDVLAVAGQSPTGFRVEATNAASAARFSWRIVAKRKDIAAPRFETVVVPAAPVLPPMPHLHPASPQPEHRGQPVRPNGLGDVKVRSNDK